MEGYIDGEDDDDQDEDDDRLNDAVCVCLLPLLSGQIDSLTGLGVVKVECGSQFSVALTKSGAVYTWYDLP